MWWANQSQRMNGINGICIESLAQAGPYHGQQSDMVLDVFPLSGLGVAGN
jgi:hypothetical protein